MITKIEVDGFRSLSNFSLDLKPGLNILVGPNGSGKTNIITFFEFLSNLIDSNLYEAVSNSGGAGSIFRKIAKNKYQDYLSATVWGYYHKHIKEKHIYYKYNFCIRVSKELDDIFFEEQLFSIKISNEKIKEPSSIEKWDLLIKQVVDKDNNPKLELQKIDRRKIRFRFFIFDESKSSIQFIRDFEESFDRRINLGDSIGFVIMNINIYGRYIINDMLGGETYNIIPSHARRLESSTKPPGIDKDGSGLSSTLYAMQEGNLRRTKRRVAYPYRHRIRTKIHSGQTIDELIGFINLANTSIASIKVLNDHFENKLKVRVTVRDGDYDAVLPLGAMSDGTLKWITLVTAVMTVRSIFSIEEPENYLHPYMQAEILSIMRTSLQRNPYSSFIIMSTHSETLLNNATPDEIVITSLDNGKTHASRPSNRKQLNSEIKRTGFGLGYYYLAEAIEK